MTKDIEKTFDEYVCILNKSKQLEKELKRIKRNFKNSQTHSKNRYKKLKEKYNEVNYCYEKLSKDHDSLKISFDELFEVYIRVRRELEQLEKENKAWCKKCKELADERIEFEKHANKHFEKVIKNLKQENLELKEKYKHRAEISNDLNKALKQYEKAFEILIDKFKFELGVSVVKEKYCYSLETLFDNQYCRITKEEYELLKEVFESVGGSDE